MHRPTGKKTCQQLKYLPTTLTLKEHVKCRLLIPNHWSYVTLCVPITNTSPDLAVDVKFDPSHPVISGSCQNTLDEFSPGLARTGKFLIKGHTRPTSLTVMVKLQKFRFPDVSVPLYITSVSPTEKSPFPCRWHSLETVAEQPNTTSTDWPELSEKTGGAHV